MMKNINLQIFRHLIDKIETHFGDKFKIIEKWKNMKNEYGEDFDYELMFLIDSGGGKNRNFDLLIGYIEEPEGFENDAERRYQNTDVRVEAKQVFDLNGWKISYLLEKGKISKEEHDRLNSNHLNLDFGDNKLISKIIEFIEKYMV